jgi:hypothetical protein
MPNSASRSSQTEKHQLASGPLFRQPPDSREFVGGSQFEVSGTDLTVAINRGVTTTDSGVPASSANTQYRLQMASDTVGTLTFTWRSVTAHATIARSDTDATLRSKITTALAGITGIGNGNVSVTGTRLQGFTIEFIGALQTQNITGLTVSSPAQSAGSVTRFTNGSSKTGCQ